MTFWNIRIRENGFRASVTLEHLFTLVSFLFFWQLSSLLLYTCLWNYVQRNAHAMIGRIKFMISPQCIHATSLVYMYTGKSQDILYLRRIIYKRWRIQWVPVCQILSCIRTWECLRTLEKCKKHLLYQSTFITQQGTRCTFLFH